MATNVMQRWEMLRCAAFKRRDELSLAQKLALAVGMAVVTGLLAQLKVPLPWTPVPITGQTFAVLLAGVLLGRNLGGLSQAIYVGLGAAGVPWFQGWQGGWGYLAGPTGGYLIGFILAAIVIGHFTERYINSRRFVSLVALMTAANFVLIYVPGLVQLNLWLNLVSGQQVGWNQVLGLGLYPFIAGDIVKIMLVAGAAWGLMPRKL